MINQNYCFLLIIISIIYLFSFNKAQVARIVHVDKDGNYNTTANKFQIMLEDKCNPGKLIYILNCFLKIKKLGITSQKTISKL